MADTIRASVHGVAEIRRDLEAVKLGLGRELSKVLKEAAGLAAQGAGPLTPYDPLHSVKRKDGLPHIRDSLYPLVVSAGTAAVASTHPGAVVHEYGGTIAPSGEPIQIKRTAMAHTAGEAELPAISALLERRISALIATHFG